MRKRENESYIHNLKETRQPKIYFKKIKVNKNYPKRKMLWAKEKMNHTSTMLKKQDSQKSISKHKSKQELQSN